MRLLTAALAMLALAAPAEAARKVPRGFYGVSYDGEVRDARGGDPGPGVAEDGGEPRGVEPRRLLVGAGAAGGGRRVRLQRERPARRKRHRARRRAAADRDGDAAVGAGEGARTGGRNGPRTSPRTSARSSPGTGPAGSFWDERADVPARPLRRWQIFNEPGRSKRYAPLLEAAHRRDQEGGPAREDRARRPDRHRGRRTVGHPPLPVPARRDPGVVRHRGAPPVHGQGGERRRGRAPVQAGDEAPRATATSRCG